MTPEMGAKIRTWQTRQPGVIPQLLFFNSHHRLFPPESYGQSPPVVSIPFVKENRETVPWQEHFQDWFTELHLPIRERLRMRIGPPSRPYAKLRGRSQGRPGGFHTWEAFLPTEGMGIWDIASGSQSDDKTIAGALILLIPTSDMRTALLAHLVKDAQARGQRIGFFDPGLGPDQTFRPGIPEAAFHRLIETYLHSDREILSWEGNRLLFHAGHGTQVLFGLISPDPFFVNPFLLFFAFLWPPLFIRFPADATSYRPPLAVFLVALLVIAILVPFGISTIFWRHLETTRERSLLDQNGHQLMESLINLDRHFVTTLQTRNQVYRQWVDQFQNIWNSISPQIIPRGGRGINRYFADFPAGSPLHHLLEQTKTWETDRTLDGLLLVASSGLIFREFNPDRAGDRKLLHLPKDERYRYIQCAMERGGSFSRKDFTTLLAGSADQLTWKEWTNWRSETKERSIRLIGELFREALRRFNVPYRSGIDREETKANLITFTIDSFEGLQGIDFGRWAKSADGEMKAYSAGNSRDFIRVEIIKNRSGAGDFLTAFCHWATTLEQKFLERLFFAGSADPKQVSMRAIALDNSARHFPEPYLHHRFQPLIDSIKPPSHGLFREIPGSNGRRQQLAVLKCPNLQGYALAAIAQLDDVNAQQADLHQRLAALTLAMGFMLFTLGFRLFRGVIRPARDLLEGVNAMEQRSYKHRIVTDTGDEWERLSSIFNVALASMAELEVAQIVQQKLMPQAPVSAGGFVFRGHTLMMSAIGGDYFDGIAAPDGRLAFILGDVSGHGVPAALVTAIAKSGFSAFVASGEQSPGEILRRMNDLVFRIVKKRRMMTCIVGIAAPDGHVILANAGQLPPLPHPPRDDFPDDQPFISFPLGILPKIKTRELTIELSLGQSLVFFSDGIIEATNAEGKVFGFTGLATTLKALSECAGQSLPEPIHRHLRFFTGEQPWQDDVTVAVLTRVTPE